MIHKDGLRRAIITNVMPQVEQGRYPAKTVLGEPLTFSASVFADGHDELAAIILIRHADQKKWQEYPLQLLHNDYWHTSLALDREGRHFFKVQAWVDHFGTWRKKFRKKVEVGQFSLTEVRIGSLLLQDIAAYADPRRKQLLLQWSDELNALQDADQALSLAFRNDIREMTLACRSQDHVTTYDRVLTIDVERNKAAFSTWYELFPRSASTEPGRHGTFKDVQRLLPRIAEMGFDVLYLPPVHPIGRKNRKGRNNSLTAAPGDPGSPWAIGNETGGHKALHPELGTLKDFKALINAASKSGIEIAMDLALQCAPDHPYVQEHPDWFVWRPDGTVQYAENPPKKYEDILPIYFETGDQQALWEELRSIVTYWIAQGIGIFRVDNPHTKPFAFWEWLISSVRSEHPHVLFLAEAFTRPRLMERLAMLGFSQSYTYFTWRNTGPELRTYMEELTRTPMRYYFRPNFWPNTPDILPPALTHGGEHAFIQRLVLAATLSSNYGLYGPVYEFGLNTPYPGKEEYTDNEKYELKHWNWQEDTRIKEIITRINRARREHKALQSTWNLAFAETTNEQILCYYKTDQASGSRVIVAVNLDPHHSQSAYVRIPPDELGIAPGTPYQLYDLLSGNSYRWAEEWNYVHLDPYEIPAHVFAVAL